MSGDLFRSMPKATRPRRHWLFKTEPEVYGIDDLERDRSTTWEGVRNYQARNLLRDEVAVGDGVLIYHSRAEPLVVAGIARISRAAHPDDTAWDPRSPYHDPGCDPNQPRWVAVDVAFAGRFVNPVTRAVLAADPGTRDMIVLQRGSRLSIQPVTAVQWQAVLRLAGFAEPR